MSIPGRLKRTARSLRALALLEIERRRTGATYTPFGPEYWSNPYPMYRSLQDGDRVHRSLLAKAWVLTRHEDVTGVLRDGRFLTDLRKLYRHTHATDQSVADHTLDEQAELPPTMLSLDPPDHTRLRALVGRAFSPRAVEALRPRIREIVKQCLDDVRPAGEMDVIQDLAVPLSVTVIAELLGVPPEDRERFKHWSDEMLLAIGYQTPNELSRSDTAARQLATYFRQVVEERRQQPRDDLISALLVAEEAGDSLSMDEVLATCHLLLNAGHAMTTNFIGTGLLALLQHPDQIELLRREPDLIGSATEELLRYDGPAQATSRFVLEDVQIGGQTIRAGEQVMLLLGAANRDSARFTNPDSLDVTRRDNHHLAFGYGVHHCLGAPLARVEAQIAFGAVIERFPKLRLGTERLDWDELMLVRSLRALPVTF
ncbi:MAG: cytochrome P450 [Dehalococcoidia bacterium]